eukprot:5672817-Prymnesium_polylepis.2
MEPAVSLACKRAVGASRRPRSSRHVRAAGACGRAHEAAPRAARTSNILARKVCVGVIGL